MRDVLTLSTVPVAIQGERQTIALDAIAVGGRLRPIKPEYVQSLAASMSERGLISPIRVRRSPVSANSVLLVAGAHRLAAARLLEWTEIDVSFRELTDDEARLDEIDENVFRNELSALDLSASLYERKIVHERLYPEAAHGKAKKPKTEKGKVANLSSFASFAKDAARKTGLSERTIQRHVELIKALGPETIAALRSTKLADNAAQLKAVAASRPEEREAIVRALAEGRATNVTRAREAAGFIARPNAEEAALTAFISAMARLDLRQLKSRLSILQDTIKLREDGKAGAEQARAAKAAAKGKAKP